MSLRRRWTAAAAAATITLIAANARADEPAAIARRLLNRYQDSVVTVKAVINSRIAIGGHEQKKESRTETIGTVIDASGLTVLSLSSIDPSKTLNNMIASRLRQTGQHFDFQIDTDVTEANIVLADGTELPAVVVLRDKDLDLAYLRPKDKPAHPLTAVDITADAHPAVLDTVACLNRLGQVANRVAAVSLEQINAVVERPRPFYVLGSGQGTSGIGAPVFTLDGKLLGLVLIRSVKVEDESNLGSMFSGGQSLGILPIIVPASDIRDGAKQALAAALPAASSPTNAPPSKPAVTNAPAEKTTP